ncbi:MAG TPA: putative zinc-binding metallopeptidase [Kineosporiaceae bacterium]
MRSFSCGRCGRLLVFENSVCMRCGTPVGFEPGARRLVPLPPDGSLRRCSNATLAACNWLVDGATGGLCPCCRLTRTRPADADTAGLVAFARAESAKRRLVFQLAELGLPVVPRADDPRGLAFDLLSSAVEPVVTGHAEGVVTLDLAEGHDAHREAMRVELAEPYRTLLGHVRHEVGHYYWAVLVSGPADGGPGLVPAGGAALALFRDAFGDERADYAEALQRHYAVGPPDGWNDTHVSAYATAHPWEDWAETFAHYLHIRDTLQTAGAYGLVVTGPDAPLADADRLVAVPSEHDLTPEPFQSLLDTWLPLTYALNAVNRSMGRDDLYPFVISPPVVAKLAVVHDLVGAAARARAELLRDVSRPQA